MNKKLIKISASVLTFVSVLIMTSCGSEISAAETTAKVETTTLTSDATTTEVYTTETTTQETTTQETATQTTTKHETTTEKNDSRTVYITPSGKRYHYDPDCGSKNSYSVSIDNIGGRTPCQKCAQ